MTHQGLGKVHKGYFFMLQRTIESVLFGVCGSMILSITYGIEYIFSGAGVEDRRVPMNLSICAQRFTDVTRLQRNYLYTYSC
jgi:hypothetical protein